MLSHAVIDWCYFITNANINHFGNLTCFFRSTTDSKWMPFVFGNDWDSNEYVVPGTILKLLGPCYDEVCNLGELFLQELVHFLEEKMSLSGVMEELYVRKNLSQSVCYTIVKGIVVSLESQSALHWFHGVSQHLVLRLGDDSLVIT